MSTEMNDIDVQKKAVGEIKVINKRLSEIQELYDTHNMTLDDFNNAKKNLEEDKAKNEKIIGEKEKPEKQPKKKGEPKEKKSAFIIFP